MYCLISDISAPIIMAPCSSTNCKQQDEELLANQAEQHKLVRNLVVVHAVKVASANTNLLKGIYDVYGEGDVVPEEVILTVISTLKAEVDARRRVIAQSKSNLEQRERLFSHPLNNNRNMMSEAELLEWRGVHRKLAVVEERRIRQVEKDIMRVALGREVKEAGAGDSDDQNPTGPSREMFRMQACTEEEEVVTDNEVENDDVEENSNQEQGNEVHLERDPFNTQSTCPLDDNVITEDTERMEEVKVVEVVAEALGEIEMHPILDQTPRLTEAVENHVLSCKYCLKAFPTAEFLLAHAKVEHWGIGRHCSLQCPVKECNFIAMRGGWGMGKVMAHMKEKHGQGNDTFHRFAFQSDF